MAGGRRASGALAALIVAFALAGSATAARKPTRAERQAIVAAANTYWCANLPRDLGPCSSWKLQVNVERISTAAQGWALAQLSAKGPADQQNTREVSTLQNVFVHQRANGTWHVTGWFLSLVYPSCRAAAKGTHVPEPVLADLGSCDQLVQTFG